MTQKHYRVEKPGQKPTRLHKHPTSPAGPACACRLCPGRARVAVSWVFWPCRSCGPRPCHRCRAAYRRRLRAMSRSCARRHARIVVCLATHCPASSSPSCRNTLYCIVMQFQPNQTVVIQYIVLQYSLLFAHLRPPCHDTLSVL